MGIQDRSFGVDPPLALAARRLGAVIDHLLRPTNVAGGGEVAGFQECLPSDVSTSPKNRSICGCRAVPIHALPAAGVVRRACAGLLIRKPEDALETLKRVLERWLRSRSGGRGPQ